MFRFGDWLRARRDSMGVTGPQLVDLLRTNGVQVTRQAVNLWENNHCHPSKEHQEALWQALGVMGETRKQVILAMHDDGSAFPAVESVS